MPQAPCPQKLKKPTSSPEDQPGIARYSKLKGAFRSSAEWARQSAAQAGFNVQATALSGSQQHADDHSCSWSSQLTDNICKQTASVLGLHLQATHKQSATAAILSRPAVETNLLFWHLTAQDLSAADTAMFSNEPSFREGPASSTPASATVDASQVKSHDQDSMWDAIDRIAGGLKHLVDVNRGLILVFLVDAARTCQPLLPLPGGGPLDLVDAENQEQAFRGVCRPVQSFQRAGLDTIQVDEHAAILAVQYCPAIIRRDHVTDFSLDAVRASGGNGCILAERLMPELAFKLGFAPKYGA